MRARCCSAHSTGARIRDLHLYVLVAVLALTYGVLYAGPPASVVVLSCCCLSSPADYCLSVFSGSLLPACLLAVLAGSSPRRVMFMQVQARRCGCRVCVCRYSYIRRM